MLCGIYKITNILNGKMYVGSSVNINKRWIKHRWELNKGRHGNEYLQRAWNQYGAENFIFEIIEETTLENIISREQYWLDSLNVCDNKVGYNLAKCAEASGRGLIRTEETRENMSEAQKGKKHSEEHKKKISEARKGHRNATKLTEEQVREIKKAISDGTKDMALARQYNVHQTTISCIKFGKSWSHIK